MIRDRLRVWNLRQRRNQRPGRIQCYDWWWRCSESLSPASVSNRQHRLNAQLTGRPRKLCQLVARLRGPTTYPEIILNALIAQP